MTAVLVPVMGKNISSLKALFTLGTGTNLDTSNSLALDPRPQPD